MLLDQAHRRELLLVREYQQRLLLLSQHEHEESLFPQLGMQAWEATASLPKLPVPTSPENLDPGLTLSPLMQELIVGLKESETSTPKTQ